MASGPARLPRPVRTSLELGNQTMTFSVRIDSATGQRYMAVAQKGKCLLADPFLNKGTAFTNRERTELDLHGLLVPAVSTLPQQLQRAYENYQAKATELERFIHLTSLHDRNETLFYRLVYENIDQMMPIVYTPVVGDACQKFSHIYREPRGVYVSYERRDDIDTILRNSGITKPSVIVITDGERVLGLGDQGAGGMGITIGKLCLYTLCAGVTPYSSLPIMLDVGTDNEQRLSDPLYLGASHRRIRGDEYQAFIDSFVSAVTRVFPHAVLQWEDFLKGNAIKQLERFRDRLCTFNDDIQGTAAVVLAGVLAALRITRQPMQAQRFVIAGAGSAAHGIAGLLVTALVEHGLTREEAIRRIWTTDSRGLVVQGREKLEEFKAIYARHREEVASYRCRDHSRVDLYDVVANVKPTVLIGTSGTPGTFTKEIVELMAHANERPIIFPVSNPTSKCECTPKDAIAWSGGRAIVATGSPFDPVVQDGVRHRIGQCNNAFIFPGVGLGLVVARAERVSDGVFLDAAKVLAAQVTEHDLMENAVYPPLSIVRTCSHAVACATVRRSVADGYADPEVLDDLEETVRRAMWFPDYLPLRYEV